MSWNIREIFTLTYLKEYCSKYKYYILISAILLLLSIILGYTISDYIKEDFIKILAEIFKNVPETDSFSGMAIYLFKNNIQANTIIMLGGLLFSLFSVMIIIINGVLIGFVGSLVNPIEFLVGIVPHGIFEIPAILLSLTGAFMITKLELNLLNALLNHQLKKEVKDSKELVKDIILTYILIIVLLIIAAIIEAGITPIILQMV